MQVGRCRRRAKRPLEPNISLSATNYQSVALSARRSASTPSERRRAAFATLLTPPSGPMPKLKLKARSALHPPPPHTEDTASAIVMFLRFRSSALQPTPPAYSPSALQSPHAPRHPAPPPSPFLAASLPQTASIHHVSTRLDTRRQMYTTLQQSADASSPQAHIHPSPARSHLTGTPISRPTDSTDSILKLRSSPTCSPRLQVVCIFTKTLHPHPNKRSRALRPKTFIPDKPRPWYRPFHAPVRTTKSAMGCHAHPRVRRLTQSSSPPDSSFATQPPHHRLHAVRLQLTERRILVSVPCSLRRGPALCRILESVELLGAYPTASMFAPRRPACDRSADAQGGSHRAYWSAAAARACPLPVCALTHCALCIVRRCAILSSLSGARGALNVDGSGGSAPHHFLSALHHQGTFAAQVHAARLRLGHRRRGERKRVQEPADAARVGVDAPEDVYTREPDQERWRGPTTRAAGASDALALCFSSPEPHRVKLVGPTARRPSRTRAPPFPHAPVHSPRMRDAPLFLNHGSPPSAFTHETASSAPCEIIIQGLLPNCDSHNTTHHVGHGHVRVRTPIAALALALSCLLSTPKHGEKNVRTHAPPHSAARLQGKALRPPRTCPVPTTPDCVAIPASKFHWGAAKRDVRALEPHMHRPYPGRRLAVRTRSPTHGYLNSLAKEGLRHF
ncbi:hypothetical protein HYPSUDRAFT_204931 [Hypholoma sublateritium FD-334 SS-4]|uniref:Uncharacterized protein n=1 Tax=Hypholoma sublateritium (strain FD-334 SS-4) TaxID=945553 RepID=A0A0D2NJE6_HYPSF|nr:hypothetical protein HYPSUDRAFT_204931 [Hypholoma sublateritium FD-334 SS-4]